MRVKKFLYLPLYVFQIFTGAKSFRDNPIIGSRILNIMGLHVFKILLSRGVWAFRQFFFMWGVSAYDRRQYRENGFILKENFLPETSFHGLKKSVKSYHGPALEAQQGDTSTWRVLINRALISTQPTFSCVKNNKAFKKLWRYTAARNETPFLYIQQIRHKNLPDASMKSDPQKVVHSDTFHPTMKCWLFLEDVPLEKGPFNFVVGSQKLTLKRLKWEYKKSITAAKSDNRYASKGSFRATTEDLTEMGLVGPKPITVKANTLVIANTNGFHCRGAVDGFSVNRLEIWGMSRTNPFNPWPGLGIPLYGWVRDTLFLRYRFWQSDQAMQQHKKPAWKKVSGRIQ